MAAAILLKQTTPLRVAAAWGKHQPHPQERLLPGYVEVKLDCWVKSDKINNWRRQPQTVDSWQRGEGQADWTRDTWGEAGNGGFGERTERVAAGILVLSHHPYGSIHPAQEYHSPPSSSSSSSTLRINNNPTPGVILPPPYGAYLTAECRETKLATEGDSYWQSQSTLSNIRLGQHLTSPETDPERKNSGKY